MAFSSATRFLAFLLVLLVAAREANAGASFARRSSPNSAGKSSNRHHAKPAFQLSPLPEVPAFVKGSGDAQKSGRVQRASITRTTTSKNIKIQKEEGYRLEASLFSPQGQ